MTGDTFCRRSLFLKPRLPKRTVRRRRRHYRDGLLLWRHHEASRTSTLRASLFQARSARRSGQGSRRTGGIRAARRSRSRRSEPPRAWHTARRRSQSGWRAPRGYRLSARSGLRAGRVIPAGCSTRHKNKNFYAACVRRVFSFVRNIFIQSFIYKYRQKGTTFAYP
jgi:hypothetical protein